MVNYQVFLSFRGPDTRNNLVEYLYEQLQRLDIEAFVDCEEIQYGDEISTTIKDAITGSDICVPVFSQDFATSPACLMEVAQMVESHKEIHPIFFFVEPCDVRYQRGPYGESFARHKRNNRYPESIIQKWKDALNKIANKKGLEFKKAALGDIADKKGLEAALREIADKKGLEAALGAIASIKGPVFKDLFGGFQELDDFIYRLWELLEKDKQHVTKNLVGIDRDVPKMIRKLGFGYQDGQVVKELEVTGTSVFVVWGMAGVSKTTLAKEVYNKIRHHFEGRSFLENVRQTIEEKGPASLQERLFRDLKRGDCPKLKFPDQGAKMIQHRFTRNRVLIVLDDVDHFKQIEPLAGELTWFGPGSTIILTSRTKDVIKLYKNPEKNEGDVFLDYEVLSMNKNHALQLFYKHAFRLDHPLEGYDSLPSEITDAVECLPFAIETVGTNLYGESKKKWTETLNGLKGGLNEEVEKMLKGHYECLRNNAKEIFLDTACFFTGVEKRIPYYMWDARGWHPYSSVGDLQNLSFLKIGEENEFMMDNQLIFLGRAIVNKDKDPRQRSRLWDYKDYMDVQTTLREEKATSKVESLRVTPDFKKVDGKVFHDLSNLRFLELDNVDIGGNPKDLLPNLVWLDWRGCPNKAKLFAFQMGKLVILNLCSSSSVKLNSGDWKKLMVKARSLKVLNLKDCSWINGSLEFPVSRHIECLILEGCSLFIPTIWNSISIFENLVSLNMKRCGLFKHLPEKLSMTRLKELFIDGTKFERLHFKKDSLPALEILSACDCKALREVTDSLGLLKNLRKLALRSCNQLNTLPHVFGELVQLQKMDLSYTSINELPPCVKYCKKLKKLKMARTFLEGFPEAIKDLKELKELDFNYCGHLSGLCDITGLLCLRILRLQGTQISEVLPRDKVHRLDILDSDSDVAEQTQDQSNAE